ncbi:MAG: hypothetical protein MRJ92_07860 [Nitrospira sp.]|nr:hypothetical protein [Nitrospira sp.]
MIRSFNWMIDLRAQLVARQAAIPPAEAQVEEQTYRIGDLNTQLKRLKAVGDSRAVSDDDIKRTWYALQMAKRTMTRHEAALKQVIAQRDETQMLLDRADRPGTRAGTILQVNVRAGEFALTIGRKRTTDGYWETCNNSKFAPRWMKSMLRCVPHRLAVAYPERHNADPPHIRAD